MCLKSDTSRMTGNEAGDFHINNGVINVVSSHGLLEFLPDTTDTTNPTPYFRSPSLASNHSQTFVSVKIKGSSRYVRTIDLIWVILVYAVP